MNVNEPTGLSKVVCVINLLDYLGSECNEPTGLSRAECNEPTGLCRSEYNEPTGLSGAVSVINLLD